MNNAQILIAVAALVLIFNVVSPNKPIDKRPPRVKSAKRISSERKHIGGQSTQEFCNEFIYRLGHVDGQKDKEKELPEEINELKEKAAKIRARLEAHEQALDLMEEEAYGPKLEGQ